MLDASNFKLLENAYLSSSGSSTFSKKLEEIAEWVDRECCFVQGVEFFSQVNRQIAENPYCHRYIGNIYRIQGEYEKACQHLQTAIAMLEGKTLRFEVLYNLGMLYREHNKLNEAEECFEEIIRAYPLSAAAHHSLSCLWLYDGKFQQGWQRHTYRIQLDQQMQQLQAYFQLPEWENKAESHVLILPEQGIGDKIMFAALFSLLPKNTHYTVVTSTRLVPLFQRSFSDISIVEGTQRNIAQLKRQHFDAYCFMGCLPRILNKPTPDHSYFLKARPYALTEESTKTCRVGISWRGGIGVESEKRSIALSLWLPILKISGINFVNLQYDAQRSEIEFLQSSGVNLDTDTGINALEDIDAFASLASSCDIVITVDNSTAHLAGSLGITTWLLLPHVPNWRWQQNGDKSYWYQSLRLIRQNEKGCWKDAIQHTAARLMSSMKN